MRYALAPAIFFFLLGWNEIGALEGFHDFDKVTIAQCAQDRADYADANGVFYHNEVLLLLGEKKDCIGTSIPAKFFQASPGYWVGKALAAQ